MQLADPLVIDLTQPAAELLQALPDEPAVFALHASSGEPYVAKTTRLRRRLQRLLRAGSANSAALSLHGIAQTVEIWRTSSQLSSSLVFYALLRDRFSQDYRKRLRLYMPSYVKLIRSNEFPRTTVTSRLSNSKSLWYGPFRTRGEAEAFESEFLDLFQLRRCHEDLAPSTEHPGCIYGEMKKCLRPCQQAVSAGGYGTEVERVAAFLLSDGVSEQRAAVAARERASEEMDFEEAARQHRRSERIAEALKLRDPLVGEVRHLNGLAVVPGAGEMSVELWPVYSGAWQTALYIKPGETASLDQAIRESFASWQPESIATLDCQDDLALLSRWYRSSWREGEWVPIDDFSRLPYRRLVRIMSKVAAG